MIVKIDNPKQMPLDIFLKILAFLNNHAVNKERVTLYYNTPQDILGALKPAVKYDRCVKMLTDLNTFWTRNGAECLFSIISEERAKGVLLSVTIEISNRKLAEFKK